jgi:hypothetical protein
VHYRSETVERFHHGFDESEPEQWWDNNVDLLQCRFPIWPTCPTMKSWRLFPACLLCLFALACSSVKTIPSRDRGNIAGDLTGVWIGKTEFSAWVIDRKADGAFSERRIQKVNVSKPPARIESVGQWRVSGNDYVLIYEKSDNPVWKAPQSWQISAEILSATPNQFEYLHREGLKITEKRTAKPFDWFSWSELSQNTTN